MMARVGMAVRVGKTERSYVEGSIIKRLIIWLKIMVHYIFIIKTSLMLDLGDRS